MRSLQRSRGGVYLFLIVVLTCTMVGCPPPVDQARGPMPSPSVTTPAGVSVPPSVTTPPAVTAPPGVEPEIMGGVPVEEPKEEAAAPEAAPAVEKAAVAPQAMGKMVAIPLELPAPAFRGTPKPLDEPNVEKPLGKPRAPFLAPEGTVNLAGGKPVVSSDPMPAAGELDFVTDGDKEASDFGYLEVRPGTEWVEIDLGEKATIYAVLVWHNHAEARVYRDVIVQVSDDPDFLQAQTVFNNDYDNSSGLGIGPDKGYVETAEGKLVDAAGVEGRYVRLYSNGNHMENKNHYTEVEVFGKPAG
ncbi:MAG TPA: hypothetical protein VMY37_37230 [Thermoguttaceae bacterium]|nr:hypothetical protein [Thermoguttaceae bacterium]